ncbi:MAG: type transport system permease protein [Thermomicrobiales bacterium]|jgi:ABC-2 type transport system permease protein|nr:type transport system permease protein [Thermomicrobiales bacterium]
MHWRNVRTIFRKDLRDAIRDARVLVAVLVPFGIGVFYNVTFDDEVATPTATVVFAAADQTELPRAILDVIQDTIDLEFRPVGTAAEVERIVGEDEADLGLVIPAGFDAAVARGERPTLTIVRPPGTNFGGDYVVAAIEPALRILAGQPPPATIDVAAVPETNEGRTVIDELGVRTWAVFAAIVMMIAMISMLAVPVILAEETEKRTIDALVLIASYGDVILAKALVGAVYVAVMVPLLLGITRLTPDDGLLFAVTVASLSATLIGFGLLLAGFFKNANQLNTWSGVILLPVIGPAFSVGLPVPDLVDRLASLFPTGSATKLLLDSASHESLFSNTATSFLVIAVWGVVAYALLYWQLSRRQA